MKRLIRTTREEREWQQKDVKKDEEKRLLSDVVQKIADDVGYQQKIDLIASSVKDPNSLILDVGAGTAGESEYLAHIGFNVIATDVNDVALAISLKRTKRFRRNPPQYVTCDGQNLSIRDASVDAVLFNESLHHMPDPLTALQEAARVLKPSGIVMLYEPYAYDPWRRISEVRDYFRGSIETSFSVRQIRRLMSESGFQIEMLSRPAFLPSSSKLKDLPFVRRVLRRTYYRVRIMFPNILGMIYCRGVKLAD